MIHRLLFGICGEGGAARAVAEQCMGKTFVSERFCISQKMKQLIYGKELPIFGNDCAYFLQNVIQLANSRAGVIL